MPAVSMTCMLTAGMLCVILSYGLSLAPMK